MAEKEYIERGSLIRHLKDELRACGDACENFNPIAYGTILGLNGAISFANTLPAADVVEVVRCKDCKYWKQVTAERHACCMIGFEMDYDEYCSYGERKQ